MIDPFLFWDLLSSFRASPTLFSALLSLAFVVGLGYFLYRACALEQMVTKTYSDRGQSFVRLAQALPSWRR